MNSLKALLNSAIDFWRAPAVRDWRTVTSGVYRNIKWDWQYDADATEPRLIGLKPSCPGCAGDARIYKDNENLVFFCPKCDRILDSVIATEVGYLEAVKAEIHRNIGVPGG